MEIERQMSEGLKNRLLRNEEIYAICVEELKDGNKIYPAHFKYAESLEFSDNFKVLREINLRRLKEVLKSIKRKLKINTRGFFKREIIRINKRRFDNHIKLNKHLIKLRALNNGFPADMEKK